MILYLIIWLIKLEDIENAVYTRVINEPRGNKDFKEIDESRNVNKIEKRFHYDLNKQIFNKEPTFALHSGKNDYDIGLFTKIINQPSSRSPQSRPLNKNETHGNYNYEYLLDEYFEEGINATKVNTTYQAKRKEAAESSFLGRIEKIFDTKNKKGSQSDISIKAITSLFIDYHNRKQPLNVFVNRLWRIIRTWLLIYIVIAIPLWCTRGLCCCCLFCNFFKPHRTIEEAKKYFVMNPPGLLKTIKGHEVLYEPTKSERDKYEEFEHLIRTI